GKGRLARQAPQFHKERMTHLIYKEVRFHHLLPHLLEVLPDFRAIGIVRDPRFVLASWFKAPREFDPDWQHLAEWRYADRKNAGLEENWYGFARWVELAKLFLELEVSHADRFLVVRYEDLVRATTSVTERLLAFCGLRATEQTRRFCRISASTDDGDPYGVCRAGRIQSLSALAHG